MATDVDQDPTAITEDQPSGPDPESTATDIGGAGVGGGAGIGAATAGPLAGPLNPMSGAPTLQVPHPGLLTRLSHGLQAQAGIPASRQVQNRFGGLITGLAGILIDGIGAGMVTPPGPAGPSQAAALAMQVGQRNQQRVQQQAMGMGQMGQLSPEQQDQFQSLQRSTQKHQADAMINSLPVEQEEQFVAPMISAYNAMVNGGYIKPLAQSTDRTAAFNKLQELRAQAGKDGAHIDMWPIGRDDQGRINWVIGQYNPLERVASDMSFTSGTFLDQTGTMLTEKDKIPANMKVGDALANMQQAYLDRAHNLALLNDAKQGKGDGNVLKEAAQTRYQQLLRTGKSPEEAENDKVYQGFLTAADDIEGLKSASKAGTGSKFMYNDKGEVVGSIDATGNRRMFTSGPPGAFTMEGLKVAQKTGDDQKNAAATLNSLQRYQGHFQQYSGQLTDGDREAMKVLTAHQDAVAQNLLDVPQSAIMDVITKEPMTGYSQKLMQGTMTKDQYDKMSPQGQQMLADYFHAVVANMYMMRQRMKGMPRNREIIEAEMRNIPLPYLSWQQAQPSFNDTSQDLSSFLGTGGSGTQTPSAQPATGATGAGVGQAPPAGATMRVPGSDGKMHWSDGKTDLGVIQ